MKRILLFILASTCLFSGFSFGMKRKNGGEFEDSKKKRRKIVDEDFVEFVFYEKGHFLEECRQSDNLFYCTDCLCSSQSAGGFFDHVAGSFHMGHVGKTKFFGYLQDDGRFHCDDCDVVYSRGVDLGSHLCKQHGYDLSSLTEKEAVGEKWWDGYFGDGGKLYCPDCGFSTEYPKVLFHHFVMEEHAGHVAYDGVCDKYKKDGKYICPGCGKTFDSAYKLRVHCGRKKKIGMGEGYKVSCNDVVVIRDKDIFKARRWLAIMERCKPLAKRIKDPEVPAVDFWFFSYHCLPEAENAGSALHALFNGVCLFSFSPDVMLDEERRNILLTKYRASRFARGKKNSSPTAHLNDLIFSFSAFEKIRGKRTPLVENVSIVNDVDFVKGPTGLLHVIHMTENIERHRKTKDTQFIFLRLDDCRWIPVRIAFNHKAKVYEVAIADSMFRNELDYLNSVVTQIKKLFYLFVIKRLDA